MDHFFAPLRRRGVVKLSVDVRGVSDVISVIGIDGWHIGERQKSTHAKRQRLNLQHGQVYHTFI